MFGCRVWLCVEGRVRTERDVVGGWQGVMGWRAAWRPQGPQARSTEKSFSSVCEAGAGLLQNLLNIKRQPPAVFLPFSIQ